MKNVINVCIGILIGFCFGMAFTNYSWEKSFHEGQVNEMKEHSMAIVEDTLFLMTKDGWSIRCDYQIKYADASKVDVNYVKAQISTSLSYLCRDYFFKDFKEKGESDKSWFAQEIRKTAEIYCGQPMLVMNVSKPKYR